MPKYIIYSHEQNDIVIDNEKPEDAISENVRFGCYTLPVWFCSEYQAVFNQIKPLMKLRADGLLHDVEQVSSGLISRYPGSGFISLGASPKLIKWRMKQKGASIRAVSVSGIKVGNLSTEPFREYLKNKIASLPKEKPIILFDFVDSGSSLYQIKRDIQAVGKCEVKTVAIGHSVQLMKHCNQLYKADLDHVFKETIPTLSDMLFTQSTKSTLGRAKPKNPYISWSHTNRVAHESAGIYQQAKLDYRAAMNAGCFRLDENDLIAILETITPPSIDEDEFEDVGNSEEYSFEW
ncbi:MULTISPECIES: hypothetical protein [Pseudomonas]|uniref:hypothetical protein n=1 Tax=Pseudomonas nitroreducens TaxID=46680 RepID=UPI001E5A27BA|nr:MULTISPECIES: hypothetical protein [Pseudomonas]MCE4072329.1 hypothetical protein [Pseudomonas nitritireducens]MCE4081805.1 hypothetical protein [Pseudomonas nitroreducens]